MLTTPRRLPVLALTLAILLTAASGCAPALPDTRADVIGPVLEVGASSGGGPSSFLVEEYDGDTLATAAWVRLDEGTRVVHRDAQGGTIEGSASDISVGTLVEVWFEGPVAESWPLQATAGVVLVVE